MKRRSFGAIVATLALVAAGVALWAEHAQRAGTTEKAPITRTIAASGTTAQPSPSHRSTAQPEPVVANARSGSVTDLKARAVDLLPLANAGDANAQSELASIYEDCMTYALNPASYIGEGRDPASTPPGFNKAVYEAAFDGHVARCNGFGPGEIHVSDINTWFATAAKEGNVDAIAHQLSRADLDPEVRKRNFDTVIASADPYAIDQLADAMGIKAEGKESSYGPISGTERDWYAWKLAACDLGLPCDANSSTAASYCLYMFVCGMGGVESIFSYVLSPSDLEVVQQKRRELYFLFKR